MLPFAVREAAFAQASGPAYQSALLAIQQRIEANDLEGARALIAEAEKRYPANAGVENLLGVVEIQQGNAAAARKDFTAALKHDPNLASVGMNLARLDMEAAESDSAARAEAIRLTQRVLLRDPGNDEARFALATLDAWDRNDRGALEQLARLSAEARSQPQVQALACESRAMVGGKEATETAVRALAANPELTELDAATCLAGLRQAKRADLITTLYTAAAGRAPLSPRGQRTLGLALEADGKLTEARSTLEGVFAASGGKEVALLTDLTRVAEATGDDKGALGYLAHARELAPEDPRLPYEFGVICLRIGFFGEARKAFAEAVRLAPETPEYNYGLGTVISFSQDPSQAIPYLEKFRSLRPDDPAGVLALGVTSFRSKDYEGAARWLRQAAQRKQTAADSHFYLGRIARQENRTEEAVAEFKQSLALDPKRADVLAELGQMAVTSHDYAQAGNYLNSALQLEPDSFAANFGLLQLYARSGDARREQQSKRFDEIKDKKEERDRLMMRVIEIRPEGNANTPQAPNESQPADKNEPQQEKQ